MSVIYEPKGKAREYSPLACNIYLGCNHGCKYCYAPALRFTTREKYIVPEARRNIIQEFESDCKKYVNSDKQVLFCFMSDPYNSKERELRLTRECLKIALKYKIPILILTKSEKILDDIDVLSKFGKNIKAGMTLTFDSSTDSLDWEPGASIPDDRIKTLKKLHETGVLTWASFEPVICPDQSLSIMQKVIDYVDYFKIGKINNYNGLDKKINWIDFLTRSIKLLREKEKPFYIKKDLRDAAQSVKLYGNEMLHDEHNLGQWVE